MSDLFGSIFNIQRFSTSDGSGIRTVVFLKGCPLDCAWCHNPESKSDVHELFFKEASCIGCGACSQVCSVQSHDFSGGMHNLNRKNCIRCGKCTEVCPSGALEMCGEKKSVDEVMAVMLRDVPFYQTSGGGITLSGGEPLLQFDFSMQLLKKAKMHGLHTAVETSGYTLRNLNEISRYVDLWLYDIKLMNEANHIRYTGVSNRIILHNLRHLSAIGAKIILRCPIIPDINMNMTHFDALADLSQLDGIQQIDIEPYHPLGISKAAQLGKNQTYSNEQFLTENELLPFIGRLREKSRVEVVV